MKSLSLLTCCILFTVKLAYGQADLTSDKTEIYQKVINLTNNKRYPVLNITLFSVSRFDVTGDLEDAGLGYKKGELNIICASPIRYYATLIEYYSSMGIPIDTSMFFSQIRGYKLDTIAKYVHSDRLIPFRKAPVSSGYPDLDLIKNLFTRNNVVCISPILFDQKNGLAFVKTYLIRKRDKHYPFDSMIQAWRKEGDRWILQTIITEKRPIRLPNGIEVY